MSVRSEMAIRAHSVHGSFLVASVQSCPTVWYSTMKGARKSHIPVKKPIAVTMSPTLACDAITSSRSLLLPCLLNVFTVTLAPTVALLHIFEHRRYQR
jgi:hypothetical protein